MFSHGLPFLSTFYKEKGHKVNRLAVGLIEQMKIVSSFQGFMHIHPFHGA